MIVNL